VLDVPLALAMKHGVEKGSEQFIGRQRGGAKTMTDKLL
jgi:hypothetical protein